MPFVFQGAETSAAQAVLAGADGIVPGLGNIVPALFSQMVQYAAEGKPETVQAIHAEILALWKLHTFDFWLVCLKYAAATLGFGSGATAGHMDHLSKVDRQTITDLVNHAMQFKPIE